MISKADWISPSLKKKLLSDVATVGLKDTFVKLLDSGFEPETILQLAKGKVAKFEDLAAAIARPGAQVVKNSKFFKGWREPEIILQGSKIRPSRYPKSKPKDFIRYPDAIVNGVSKEAKTGYVKMSKRIKAQIEKDAKLVSRQEVDAAEWHFFPSGRSNSIGADKAVLDLLDEKGISYFFHIP